MNLGVVDKFNNLQVNADGILDWDHTDERPLSRDTAVSLQEKFYVHVVSHTAQMILSCMNLFELPLEEI